MNDETQQVISRAKDLFRAYAEDMLAWSAAQAGQQQLQLTQAQLLEAAARVYLHLLTIGFDYEAQTFEMTRRLVTMSIDIAAAFPHPEG